MAATKKSQLYGYFHNILYIIHSVMASTLISPFSFVLVIACFKWGYWLCLFGCTISCCLRTVKQKCCHCIVAWHNLDGIALIYINASQFRVAMDICACLVLSGKKLDSLRRRRSWLSFLALWFQVTEYCEEMERVLACRLGGAGQRWRREDSTPA